ncbi:leucine-rich repeat-containing protein 70-like [Coccinella septempunctata]|uniref:leucine-rich repeat-containing protein 70-like n=1 Tax=Coccinella septempunctata TaxID=41139 RepID=UPI001D086C77|nr:leucine-rich repeat-containing protein 70-like [Coccinella septempunctata]
MCKQLRKLSVILCLLLIVSTRADDNPDENFSNFETSVDVCNKCECNTYSDLFFLNCKSRDMHHTLSNWPSHENKTLRATFSYNIITSLEKFPSSNCSAMLTLSHCSIKYLAPGLFENMKNVSYVDFSYNLLTGDQVSKEKFKGPYNNKENEPIEIRHLNLAYNRIHSLKKSLFEHMPRLKHLSLEGNRFKILDLQTQAALTSVPNLEYLNLGNNGLRELPRELFKELRKLLEINLFKNQFEQVPDVLANVDALEVLILDSNLIYELTDGTFAGFDNLIELSLNNLTNVVEVHANTFTPLKKLRKLFMSDNKYLEVIENDAFGRGNGMSIRELYLNNNNLMDIPSVLLDWPSLHVFEFNGNPLLCSCNLYNISKSLDKRITRLKAGPYCIGDEEMSFQVFSIDDKVCREGYLASLSFRNDFRRKFSAIRVVLITVSLVALTATFVAIVVCFAKQRKYGILGQNQFSRSTTILYNPLSRQPTL